MGCIMCMVCIVDCFLAVLPITNYKMAPSKRGAGGGSATHKEPTLDLYMR